MRLVVLSDVHGNIMALEKCFEIIDKENIDGIIWCGDYITDMPFSEEVLNFMKVKNKEYKNWIVRGNREDYIIDYHNGNSELSLNNNTGPILLTYNSLSKENIDYISQMPSSTIINIEGAPSIYVIHRYKDIQYNDRFKYKYVVFGHEHNQLYFIRKGIKFITPGSVGLPTDGIAGTSFMILNFKGNEWQPEFYNVEYDIASTVKSIKESKLNDLPVKWGEALIKELETGDDITGMYLNEARSIAEKLNIPSKLEEFSQEVWDEAIKKIEMY